MFKGIRHRNTLIIIRDRRQIRPVEIPVLPCQTWNNKSPGLGDLRSELTNLTQGRSWENLVSRCPPHIAPARRGDKSGYSLDDPIPDLRIPNSMRCKQKYRAESHGWTLDASSTKILSFCSDDAKFWLRFQVSVHERHTVNSFNSFRMYALNAQGGWYKTDLQANAVTPGGF